MKKTLTLLTGALLALAAVNSQAVTLTGSLPLVGLNTTQNGANLNISTLFSMTPVIASGNGVGDYSPILTGTSFGNASIDLAQVATGFGFTLNNATYGSFAPISGIIVQQTANFLDLYVLGTFTPLAGLGAFDPTESSLRISLNQSGSSVSAAITLNSPAVPVTAPDASSSLVLSLIGMAALGLAQLRSKF